MTVSFTLRLLADAANNNNHYGNEGETSKDNANDCPSRESIFEGGVHSYSNLEILKVVNCVVLSQKGITKNVH